MKDAKDAASSHAGPKVLLVGPSFAGGGAERHFRNLSRFLEGMQVDVCVLRAGDAGPPPGMRGRVIDLGWKSEFSYLRIVRALRKLLAGEGYDAAVGFGLFPSAALRFALMGLRRRPGFVAIEITRPWEALKKNGLFRRLLHAGLYRSVYRAAGLLAANSADGLDECVRHFGADEAKTRLLPNLIDREELTRRAEEGPAARGTDDNTMLIVGVARLIRMKRFDTLIEAGARLAGDRSWRIEILGDGPELSNLKALAEARGISDRVMFPGWVDNPSLFVKRATAFVLCSEYEGFSNSLLEAMFLGAPVVTSFCSKDVREICAQGAARGFEPGDAAALAEHISALLGSSEEREKLRSAAFSYCARHDARAGIRAYEKAIRESIVAASGSPS